MKLFNEAYVGTGGKLSVKKNIIEVDKSGVVDVKDESIVDSLKASGFIDAEKAKGKLESLKRAKLEKDRQEKVAHLRNPNVPHMNSDEAVAGKPVKAKELFKGSTSDASREELEEKAEKAEDKKEEKAVKKKPRFVRSSK